ncbi:MAG: ankyrin repeat domain-containing protein [Alphaproteobacteria bacterium]
MTAVLDPGLVEEQLKQAVSREDTDEIHNALNAGANINAWQEEGFTLLQFAISKGKNDSVAVLLERGADPEVPAKGEQGYKALHVAAAAKNEKALQLLLQRDPDLDCAGKSGETPLHVAAAAGALAIAKLLVEAGADLQPMDINRETPRAIAERIASETETRGIEPHFDTARYLQGIEDERNQSVRKQVERDVTVLKSYHPERFKIKPKLGM